MEVADSLEAHLAQALRDLEAADLRRDRRVLRWTSPTRALLDGREVVVFGSNDYLGLARRSDGVPARGELSDEVGAGASRLVTGTTASHEALELELAEWLGSPSALLFNSGYHANGGIFAALLDERDVVFSDALNHASLIDGMRLCRARRAVFPHGDLGALRELLRDAADARVRLIVCESVYSMDGDRAPLAELCDLARTHDAALVVDEAHAIGVFGDEGQGLCAEVGVAGNVAGRIGTCGKALGSFGAFVAGSEALCEVLYNRARSFVFTTALPPSVVETTRGAIPLVREPERRARLWRRIDRLRSGLREAGLIPEAPPSPVIPVVVGEAAAALRVSQTLLERGLLVPAIRPPTVPKGTARLRITVSSENGDDEIDALVRALAEVVDRR